MLGNDTTDITTSADEDLTLVAAGTGIIELNDSVTSYGTLTFSGVGTDITTATDEDLTLVANGAGVITLNDTTNIGSSTTGIQVTTDGSISDIDDAYVSFGESIDVTGDASVSGSLVLYSGTSTIDVLDNSILTIQGSYQW